MPEIELPILDLAATPPSMLPLGVGKKVYVETYGCSMNVSDSEIVLGVMHANGYAQTDTPDNADVILINTCSIRENAEHKVHTRLNMLKYYRKRKADLVVGVLGCMAERLRGKLLEERLVDVVVGPDEYRKLPTLVDAAFDGSKGVAVQLSRIETYEDLMPVRKEGRSAFVSISRGCDKFCTFCVVPFTRGRERSRSMLSVVDEVRMLWDQGFKETTLLGQNVNSYRDDTSGADFADLLTACAKATPQMRLRYSTPHPQDMSEKLIETMASHDAICKFIHVPLQSGSDRILELMNRTYRVDHYLRLIERIRHAMPMVSLSTDIIAGFCTETEDDHRMTMDVMRAVRYDLAYMYAYSPRENTKAWKMGDDVPHDVKIRRLNEIIEQQVQISGELFATNIGATEEILVDGPSKRNAMEWQGRTDTNRVVIFPHDHLRGYNVGDLVTVRILRSSSATLFGELL